MLVSLQPRPISQQITLPDRLQGASHCIMLHTALWCAVHSVHCGVYCTVHQHSEFQGRVLITAAATRIRPPQPAGGLVWPGKTHYSYSL